MTQMDVWTFREEAIGDIDLTGFEIEATDGSIGKVDEATYDVGASYLVVDTGPWIFGRQVVLPAGTVERIDAEQERVFVNRTKDEIKNAPEFDLSEGYRHEQHGPELGRYYGEPTAAGAPRRRDEPMV